MGLPGIKLPAQDEVLCLMQGIGDREIENMVLATKPKTTDDVVAEVRALSQHEGNNGGSF